MQIQQSDFWDLRSCESWHNTSPSDRQLAIRLWRLLDHFLKEEAHTKEQALMKTSVQVK